MRIACIAAAVLILAFLPVYEKKLDSCLAVLKAKAASLYSSCITETNVVEEDDILSNKSKWRMLIIGYCVFILFMIFSTVSILTLNTKINNLSAAVGDITDRITELESR